MADRYSLYDAKANLSRIVKQVRESGQSVVVTVHGEPAVEIRAYSTLPLDLESRIVELTARGVVKPAVQSPKDYVWKARTRRRPGGLKRFLDERDAD